MQNAQRNSYQTRQEKEAKTLQILPTLLVHGEDISFPNVRPVCQQVNSINLSLGFISSYTVGGLHNCSSEAIALALGIASPSSLNLASQYMIDDNTY